MYKKLKSQAALEFLTTYGWAFLVIVIMIGALAYFGILSPSKVLPNRCNFGSEFQCVDYAISVTGNTFKLRIKNSVGQPINIDAAKITLGSESVTQYSCTLTPSTQLPITAWKSGDTKDFTWDACNSATAGFAADDKAKVLVTIKYYPTSSSSTYEKEVKGEVFSTAT